MNMKKIFLALVAPVILMSCEGGEEHVNLFRHVEKLDIDHGVLGWNTYMEGDAHSGNLFSRTGPGANFGFGYNYVLPDSLKGETVVVDVNAWVRSGDLSNNCELIISAAGRDSLLLWQGLGIRNAIKNANEWTNVKGTAILPAHMTYLNPFIVKVMAHNIDAKSYLDVDDCEIVISQEGGE